MAGSLLALVMLSKITCSSLGAERIVSAVSVLVLLSQEDLVPELQLDVLLVLLGELLTWVSASCLVCATLWEAANSLCTNCTPILSLGRLCKFILYREHVSGLSDASEVAAMRCDQTLNVCRMCLLELCSLSLMHWTTLNV